MGIQSTNNTATLNIYTAKEFNGIAGFSKHNFDTIFEPLQRLFGLSENKPSEKIEGYVMDHAPSLTRNFTENDQVMDGSRNILLGNQSLLLNNQGLLHSANTGFFLDIAFMLMVINSKTDRNYEAILKMETKVDQNYETIRRVKNKVDRNLEVMLSKFKISERNLSNTMEKVFTDIVDFVRQTRIEGVTSELITFMKYFIQEKDAIRYLTHDQYVTKLDEVNDILGVGECSKKCVKPHF